MEFANLATRLFNTPLALHPRKAEVAIAALSERLGITHIASLDGVPMRALSDDDRPFTRAKERGTDGGYDTVEGVALVPVSGMLVQKLGSLRPSSGMTGYNGIRQSLATALNDPAVRAVAMNIDSGGGEVAGCFDLADEIYGARGGEKPIWAILDESAFSAAYLVASACDRVIVPRTGGTGSIGIITMHVDLSMALSKAGVRVTFIHKGDRKTDGRKELPLSDTALASIQADIDEVGALFDDTVARNRDMTASTISDFEAGTFLGGAGVAAGLADAVMSPADAFRALIDHIN